MEQAAFGDGAVCFLDSDQRNRAVFKWLDVRLQRGGTAQRAVEQSALGAVAAVAVTAAVMAATAEAMAPTRHQLLPHRRPTDRHRVVEALVV